MPVAKEPFTLFTPLDIHLFREGTHYRLYEKLGAHVVRHEDKEGVYFAVWAPNANSLSVIGDFNKWNRQAHPMQARADGSGIWETFIPGIGKGTYYKYYIKSNIYNLELEKADPFAFKAEMPPGTASIVWDADYTWKDEKWLNNRAAHNSLQAPYAVYEVHLGSWMRKSEKKNDYFNYYEITDKLVPYVKEMGFTHVEFMPLMGFPYDGSWGYQVVSYFACAAFFGDPQGLMHLIDAFHKEGIGVIMDWVPSHFPGDGHGLIRFDGSCLYEHEDPRKGFHPDWKSYIYNYGRNEVRSFLISNALFWLDKYHIDGLRVDAVASMLYLDYSRNEGEWLPNKYGGNENLEAIGFIKEFNKAVYKEFPDTQTMAEESTSYAGVSHPTYTGGLGFGMKWMMGWMHDTFKYFALDPLYRKFHHNQITFSTAYAFSENFMLPVSHDEVVHGKSALIYKMPGNEKEKFANLRTLLAYMYTHPGTKLIFMGCEFAQTAEWNYLAGLSWELLQYAPHKGVQQLVKDLNHIYKTNEALYSQQFKAEGFEWLEANDAQNSTLAYMRYGYTDKILTVLNLTPIARPSYRIAMPGEGTVELILNTDSTLYAGNNYLDNEGKHIRGKISVEAVPHNGKLHSVELTLPPLSALVFKYNTLLEQSTKEVKMKKKKT